MDIFKRMALIIQVRKTLKKNGFNRRKFRKDMRAHLNRELDINEILSREYSTGAVTDAYEYCMRKCNWDPSTLTDSNVRDFLLCLVFMGEVDNGGVIQFLSNSSGDMAAETVKALQRIDNRVADSLTEALKYFPDGIAPRNRDERNALIDQFEEDIEKRLDELDGAVYEVEVNIDRQCYEFIQAHKNDFLKF